MFKIIEAKDEELIKEIYKFRYHIACEVDNIFNKDSYIDEIERDEYDEYSLHFAILNEREEIIACVRLVHNSKVGYPTPNALKVYENEKEYIKPKEKQVGELSRIFIREDYRGLRMSKNIINLLKYQTCIKMSELHIVYSYGSLEESFFRLLHVLKMPYRRIGPYQLYGNRLRAPCIMFTKDLIEQNKEIFFEMAY